MYVSSEARKVGHGHDCSLLLLSLTFKINEGTTAGTYPITMTCDPSNTYDANDNDVNLEFVYGSIVVNG